MMPAAGNRAPGGGDGCAWKDTWAGAMPGGAPKAIVAVAMPRGRPQFLRLHVVRAGQLTLAQPPHRQLPSGVPAAIVDSNYAGCSTSGAALESVRATWGGGGESMNAALNGHARTSMLGRARPQ